MDAQQQAVVEVTATTIGSKATYVGSGAAITGWLMSNEFAVLGGLLLGVGGFLVNLYYQRKRDHREQHEHELRNAREQREHDARMGLYQ